MSNSPSGPHSTPSTHSTRDVVNVALFAALIALFGLVPRIDLPFLAGVPITVQTLGVMLAGLLLGPRLAAMAVLLFLFMVLLGAPFLSGGRGGLGVLFGPTVGFLLGWIPGALIVGFIYSSLTQASSTNAKYRTPRRGFSLFFAAALASFLGGVLVVYALGIPMLAWRANMALDQAAAVTLAFLPGDILKLLVAASIARALHSPPVYAEEGKGE
ncbi:MAG: biotin transporter BioY [Burkholderiaceae bacterium]